jgi:hypothetical protein
MREGREFRPDRYLAVTRRELNGTPPATVDYQSRPEDWTEPWGTTPGWQSPLEDWTDLTPDGDCDLAVSPGVVAAHMGAKQGEPSVEARSDHRADAAVPIASTYARGGMTTETEEKRPRAVER